MTAICRWAPWTSLHAQVVGPALEAGNDPVMCAKLKRTIAITRPKKQSAFQKAVFMNSP